MENSSLKLLVVEDEPMVRSALSKVFGKFDFSVESADGYHAALEKIESFSPDLVLTDLVYAGPNSSKTGGLDLLRQIRELRSQPPYDRLETFLMSGKLYHEVEVQKALFLTTSKLFLQKPFSPKDAAAMLLDYMQKSRSS